MAGKTTPDQADATRAEILRHAHDLFSHYGFNKTNIGDIARCCGMSPGNLYRYYKNKQAIGVAAVRQYFDQAETAMQAAVEAPGGTAEARIRRFLTTGISHIVDELLRNPKMVELAEFICVDDAGWEMLQDHVVWRREWVIREIERGIASGELATDDPTRTAISLQIALKVFWMPETLALWRDKSTILPELDGVLDLLFRGLRAR